MRATVVTGRARHAAAAGPAVDVLLQDRRIEVLSAKASMISLIEYWVKKSSQRGRTGLKRPTLTHDQ